MSHERAERLRDQAGALVDLLHSDTAYAAGSSVLEAGAAWGPDDHARRAQPRCPVHVDRRFTGGDRRGRPIAMIRPATADDERAITALAERAYSRYRLASIQISKPVT